MPIVQVDLIFAPKVAFTLFQIWGISRPLPIA